MLCLLLIHPLFCSAGGGEICENCVVDFDADESKEKVDPKASEKSSGSKLKLKRPFKRSGLKLKLKLPPSAQRDRKSVNSKGNREQEPVLETSRIFNGMEFVWIPAGDYFRGSSQDEKGHSKNESPKHKVTISRGFWIGKYEVSRKEWHKITGKWPGVYESCGDDCPAAKISYNDIHEQFLARLNARTPGCSAEVKSDKEIQQQKEGCYRLPTEAEWEYAARAGTETPFFFGEKADKEHTNIMRWHRGPTKKGSFPGNPWGLHDVHGNVAEYCLDSYEKHVYKNCSKGCTDPLFQENGKKPVVRGGFAASPPKMSRSAYRTGRYKPSRGTMYVGFRVLRTGKPQQ